MLGEESSSEKRYVDWKARNACKLYSTEFPRNLDTLIFNKKQSNTNL